MFVLKSLVAASVLGLARDMVVTAACCGADSCGRAVMLASHAKEDCSSVLIKTVPITTTTSWYTSTTDVYTTNIKLVTASTDITITAIDSETAYSTETSTTTTDETETITAIPTVLQTVVSVVTETTSSITTVAPLRIKRHHPKKPDYASTCDDAAYTSACVCLGVSPSTITNPSSTKTIWKTQTAYETIDVTQSSLTGVLTNSEVKTLTTLTTIIQDTIVTQTSTIPVTLTDSTTLIETIVSTAVTTLAPSMPTPPTCNGHGFRFIIESGSPSIVGSYLGLINSIGQGIYIRTFSGGGTAFTVDSNGDIEDFYPNDLTMVVKTGPPPYQIMFSSVQSQVSYSFPTMPASCQIGGAPDFALSCTVQNTTYFPATCLDAYYENNLWVYSEPSQLGSSCSNISLASAQCLS